MSTIDSEDRNVTGYFLPEDTQLRLKQLREYVGFLTNLARPRRPDEDSECYNEIRPGEVAICFELIEEQIALVLDELSWPGERGEQAREEAPEAETAADFDETETPAEARDTAEPAAAKRYSYGLTLEQIDEMQLLLSSLRALANVVTCADHAEYNKATLSTMGDAIYRDVEKLRGILDAVDDTQRLNPRTTPRPGVAEEHAAYLALPERLPSSSTWYAAQPQPMYH
ncbi:XAC0095 family protein [Dyella sp. KULCS107]|uniref:XAC0095 family protein n=1 Tax=Dyella sp. KULCS107 TaxID=3422216 RepID=UPI003D6E682C